MPKSTKKSTKRGRTTLKDLPATAKEVSKKEKKRIGGKGGIAPMNTIGSPHYTITPPRFTVSSPVINPG